MMPRRLMMTGAGAVGGRGSFQGNTYHYLRYKVAILREVHPCSQTQTGVFARRGKCHAHHRKLAQHERHSRKSSGHGVLSSWWSALYVVRELAEHCWFSTTRLETPGVIEQVLQPRL